MSKRDKFVENIKKQTGARTLSSAIKGWKFVNGIALDGSRPMVPCELCGTLFRIGAMIRHTGNGKRRPDIISVGGTCLNTICRGSFADRAAIAVRKRDVTARLRKTYGRLIPDLGDWIHWLVEKVPERLKPLAAQLQCLGMVPSDRELNSLIKFHDANRTYPVEALLPPWFRAVRVVAIPNRITIDEARALVAGRTCTEWGKILKRASDDYRRQELQDLIQFDTDWQVAWRPRSPLEKRAITALAKLSDRMHELDPTKVQRALSGFPWNPTTHLVPFFTWVDRRGLALVTELSDEIGDDGTAWLCGTKEEKHVDLATCMSIERPSEGTVSDLEACVLAAYTVVDSAKDPSHELCQSGGHKHAASAAPR